MSRLTKKFEDNSGYTPIVNHPVRKEITLYDFEEEDYDCCVEKLAQLEDIEDELGCPLDVVFRALNEGIVINEKGYVYSAYNNKKFNAEEDSYYDCLTLSKVGNYYFFEDINHPYGDPECGSIGCCVRLSNYQKTWWLKGEKDDAN